MTDCIDTLRMSPLHELHVHLGAQMHAEAGWWMPKSFTGLLREHLAATTGCAVFDLSAMGKFAVAGQAATRRLEDVLSCRVGDCLRGRCARTLMLGAEGGIMDRMVLCREDDYRWFLLGQAAMQQRDATWLRDLFTEGGTPELRDETQRWCCMGVYGPMCGMVFARLLKGLDMPAPMGIRRLVYREEELLLTRCGLVHEQGFELFCSPTSGQSWYERLIACGAVPCGAEVRECLRVEHAMPLVGCDIGSDHLPREAGLERYCDADKLAAAEAKYQKTGEVSMPVMRLVAVCCTQGAQALPQRGDELQDDQGTTVGFVTSGCQPPDTGRGMALAWLTISEARAGQHLSLTLEDGRVVPVRVMQLEMN